MGQRSDIKISNGDLISRSALLTDIENGNSPVTGYAIKDWISAAPAVDAVEVVRCKDCRFWQDNNSGYPHEECRWGKEETPDADDFCSYGERRAGE